MLKPIIGRVCNLHNKYTVLHYFYKEEIFGLLFLKVKILNRILKKQQFLLVAPRTRLFNGFAVISFAHATLNIPAIRQVKKKKNMPLHFS